MPMTKPGRLVALAAFAISGAGSIFLAIQPSQVTLTRSIDISAPAPVVYGETMALLGTLKWDGVKGKNPQWIDERLDNRRIRCGLTELGFRGTSYTAFELTSEGAGVKLTSTYEARVDGPQEKIVFLFTRTKIEKDYERMLIAIKGASERRLHSGIH